ncbi:hypothetical protein [Brasilonema bromeliae]|uniref:Replication protein n=1 Tax=Brasilonema bromeliae SPC951 TaxID=385972 RepID=A0ABX1P8R6_9CYAN|nr:hypothetical protein [Brasilonema bromeliae]NMG20832.1 hypothetical protein [Brasilonema bromeliae SPC951]
MPIKRVVKNNATYLYLTEEVYDPEKKRGKTVVKKTLGVEEPAAPLNSMTEEFAVVWAENRTLGNAVPFSDRVTGQFPPENNGHGVILPCDIVECGKFRNGKLRWWCRTHQVHWGTKADIQQASESEEGAIRCSNATQPMNYVKNPLILNPDDYAGGIGIWAALPTAINTTVYPDLANVEVHVHVRPEPRGKKTIDANFPAIVIRSTDHTPLFANVSIKRVVIASPSALAYLEALINNLPLGTLYCNRCNHPHLDLGDFAKNPHKKHFCGNCGSDSNWSSEAIVSSPIKELADKLNGNLMFVRSDRKLDLRDYADCQFKIWASTPAILWTSELSQEIGIHVHVYRSDKKIIDNTFGDVTWTDGTKLERENLLSQMLQKCRQQKAPSV